MIYHSRSSLLTRTTKLCGQFQIPSSARFQQLETGTIHLSKDQEQMGPPHNRSFCKQTDNTTTQVCELDTFTLDWSQLKGYAFPPFALIERCLKQVLCQSVSQSINVTPVWETQPWYPLLLEMTIDNPLFLPWFPGLLRRENELHPLAHLQLAAWLVSGVDMKVQQFHCQLKDCSWPHGEPGQKKLILQPGESGLVGVMNNKSIPSQHL